MMYAINHLATVIRIGTGWCTCLAIARLGRGGGLSRQ